MDTMNMEAEGTEVHVPENKIGQRNKSLRVVYILCIAWYCIVMVAVLSLFFGLLLSYQFVESLMPGVTGQLRFGVMILFSILLLSLVPAQMLRFKRYKLEQRAKGDFSGFFLVFSLSLVRKWFRVRQDPNRYFEPEDYAQWSKVVYLNFALTVILLLTIVICIQLFIR